jgi:hypothetical protein
MLSTAIEESFSQVATAIANRAASTFRENGAHVSRSFQQAGHSGYSSRHVAVLIETATNAFNSGAAEVYGALMTACEAEPTKNVQTRIAQFENLIDLQLIALGDTVMQALNGRIMPMIALRAANHSMIAPLQAGFEEAIAAKKAELRAKVQIDVRRAAGSFAQASSIHISGNATIGALLTGNHATASVTQTVNLAGREELKAAIDALVAVVRASNAPAKDQREIIDVLDEVKTESDKPAPNKLKIGGALSVTGAAVSIMADGPSAFANVMSSWESLKNLLGG